MSAPAASHPENTSTESLRNRVVNVLSATVNGCLNELGYHPAILQRLKAAEQLVAHLTTQKTKLYQDNCRLVSLHKSNQESFNSLSTPQAAQIKRLQDLSREVNFLTEERNLWARQHDSLVIDHRKALNNFNNLRELHAVALKDIGELREECARLRGNGYYREGPPQTTRTVDQNRPIIGRPPKSTRLVPLHQAHLQSDQNPMQLVPVRLPPSSVPAALPAPPSLPMVPPKASRRSSAPVPERMPSWGAVAQLSPSQVPNPNYFTYHVPSNAPPINSRPSLSVNIRQALDPNVPRSSSSTPATGPQQQPRSAPVTLSTVHNFAQNQLSTFPSTSLPDPPSRSNAYACPLRAGSITSHSLKRKSLTPTTSTPALSPANHTSPLETVEARTPVDPSIFTGDLREAPELARQSSPQSTNVDPKNPNDSFDLSERDNVVYKKPRLETPVPEPCADPNEVKSEPESEHMLEGKDFDDEESDDEVVEVDADGLRVPRACVEIIMEADENDSTVQLCRCCETRYSEKLIPEAPKPFVGATLDELVQHCMNEHPAAWDHLRRCVGRQQ